MIDEDVILSRSVYNDTASFLLLPLFSLSTLLQRARKPVPTDGQLKVSDSGKSIQSSVFVSSFAISSSIELTTYLDSSQSKCLPP